MSPHVIVVDDDEVKSNALVSEMRTLGVPEDHIVSVTDASAARRVLNARFFDVMLLDVLLPAHSGAKPAGETSVDFLREILEDGALHAPTHIVAITADAEAVDRHGPAFRQMVAQVLHVQVDSASWRQSLKVLLSRTEAERLAKSAYDLDVCIQTALRRPELSSLLSTWDANWSPEEHIARGVLIRRGTLRIGTTQVRVACAHASQMGIAATMHLSSVLLAEFRPRVLAMTGICGGVGAGMGLGDVVVADKSWDWQSGKWNEKGELLTAMDQKEASPDLVAWSRGSEDDIQRWSESFSGKRPKRTPLLHVAPIVSGSAVVQHSAMRQIMLEQHRKVAAVDMECYGLYFAANNARVPSPKVLCVKSVSDMADVSKVDDYQEYCSYLSARVLLATLERYFGAASH
jgi:nucleoside phosphorylase